MATAPERTSKTPSGSPTAGARQRSEQAGTAMAGGRFPINNRADLLNAIDAEPLAKGDRAAVRRFIIKRAKALGLSDLIPDSWHEDGATDGDA